MTLSLTEDQTELNLGKTEIEKAIYKRTITKHLHNKVTNLIKSTLSIRSLGEAR